MSWGLWGLDKTAGADDFPFRYTGYPQVATVHMPTDIAHYYRFNDGIDGTERDEKRLRAGMSTLTDSIAADGIQRPIEINTDGKHASIIDGHHRLGCARRLGLETVPVTINWERDCSGPNQKPVEGHLRQILTDNPGPYQADRHAAVEADVADDLMRLAGQDPYDTDDHRHTARVDAAEQVMTRSGLTGKDFHFPGATPAEAKPLGIDAICATTSHLE